MQTDLVKEHIINDSQRRNPFYVKPQFIACLDILGYKEKMKELGGAEELLRALYIAIEQARGILEEISTREAVDAVTVRAFSDNIIICSEKRWDILLAITALSQAEFHRRGIFVRGALCYGGICIHSEFVFGEGIILAHEIESKIVIFPRVIIHESFANAVIANGKKTEPENVFEFIGMGMPNFVDFDGFMVLDYINLY